MLYASVLTSKNIHMQLIALKNCVVGFFFLVVFFFLRNNSSPVCFYSQMADIVQCSSPYLNKVLNLIS